MRVISLNGNWKCRPDRENVGMTEEWFSAQNYKSIQSELLDINIPASFNTLDGYAVYEGVFWHFHQFSINNLSQNEDCTYQLHFKGANYNSKVWLNGEYLGEFNGGFTPFTFNVAKLLKKENNFLAVRTDSARRDDQIPAFVFDWYNWGGIYRDVELHELNSNRLKDVTIKTKVPSRAIAKIEISYKIIGEVALKWQILDTDLTTVLYYGEVSEAQKDGSFTISIPQPRLWSPDRPHLYHLKLLSNNPQSKDEILYESHFGIREILIRGPAIYLNRKRIFFKGASLHEELMPYGRTYPYEEREKDLKRMKELGFNALRTAHYSHDESLIEIADKLGMLILEEIPVYWGCEWRNPETFRTAAKQLRSLIKRDINHPSVVWWSVGNEIPIERYECAKFINRLMDYTRLLDDTRMVTFVSNKFFSDLIRHKADVATINAYFGWYYGGVNMINMVLEVMRVPLFNKPWFYTEFGSGAKKGFLPGMKQHLKFSEERQLLTLDYSIRTFNSKDYVAGWFIWIYRDFRSLLRQNEYQEGYNRKGIVSEKNEPKLIYNRIPKILNQKRKMLSNRYLAIFIWLLMFPFVYIATYIIFDGLLIFGQKKQVDSGLKKERERYYRERGEN